MRRGRVCGESFIPDMRREGVSGESFIPDMRRGRVCGESFVPMRRGRVCGESFVPMRRGVVLVGRIRSCSGVVLVPVGGLWRHPAAARGCRSQASGALHTCGARCAEGDPRRLKAPARPRRRPRAPQPGPPVPPAPSTLAGRGVLLWLAPSLTCIRYKVRPAWLLPGENGRKFATHAQNTPNWAISSEQGEFCTAHAVRRGLQGEFCTGSGPARFLMGECCVASAPSGCPPAGFGPPPIGPMRR